MPYRSLRLCASALAASLFLAAAPCLYVSAAVPEPNWHIAQTNYETDSYIVAGYEAKDFGIIADGITDTTENIQTALNSLYQLGGGTLFLPEGRYAVRGTLKIPQGVTLAGDWLSPANNSGKAAGTILMAYSGRGHEDINNNQDSDADSIPFITLEPNSSVRGLNIWYPEQTADNITVYPTTIRMYDPNTWGADSARISDVTFINAYNAIRQGPYESGCPNVENVYIAPISTAIEMDGLADVGRFTNIHISPDYWINAGLDNAAEHEAELRAYMKGNATGIRLGRIDWSYLSFAEVNGCRHGIEFVLSHSRLSYSDLDLNGEMTAWSYPNGQSYHIDISDCEVGLYSEGNSGAGELVAELDITGCDTGIKVVDGERSDNGNLEIANANISGSGYAIDYNGLGRLSINNSDISGSVNVTGGYMSMAGCDFNGCKKIEASGGAKQLILSACDNLPEVSGNATYNNDKYITPYVKTLDAEPSRVTKPSKADIYVVTGAPFYAPYREIHFASFDEPSDEDASEAIQAALDKAAENGGGIVFCPPGRYTINTPLNVAPGVELRGAADGARIPLKLGTIFDTPVPESEFLNTDFMSLNTGTVNGIENVPRGNAIFNEIPSPVTDEGLERSVTVTPYGLRLYSEAGAEQAHAFDHSTQLECGSGDSKYIVEAIVNPKSIKAHGEFFITLSKNTATELSGGNVSNKASDALRIANFKADDNTLQIPGGSTKFSYDKLYIFRWELDLTDINNKTITSSVISSDGSIYTAPAARFPDAYQGNDSNVGHILLQASKVSADKNPEGASEVYVHGVSVKRAGAGAGDAWVRLNQSSGINGITFNCMGQKYLPSPSQSPYMIEGAGGNIYIRNIALRNVYDGIDLKSQPCDGFYMDGITGIAWHSQIDIANSANGILANTQFNWGQLLYGSQTKLGCWEDSPINGYTDDEGGSIDPRGTLISPYMEKYLAMQLDCVTVDDCRDILLYNNFSIFGSSSLTLMGSTDALCVGQGADGSRLGMRVADSAAADFINTQIVSFYHTDSSHITADPGYTGRSVFLNTSAWSTPAVNIRAGGGDIYVFNPTFNGCGRNAVIDAYSSSYVYVQSGWINNTSPDIVTGSGDVLIRDSFFRRTPALPEAPEAKPIPDPNRKPDTLTLDVSDNGNGLTMNAYASINNAANAPYTAILAVYGSDGRLVYTDFYSELAADTKSAEYTDITLPYADCYKAVFMRWSDLDNNMIPVADALTSVYTK